MNNQKVNPHKPLTQIPFAIIPEWVLALNLTGAELKVYIRIKMRAGQKGYAWESVKTMAEACHITTRGCQKALRGLEAKEAIRCHQRNQKSSIYVILDRSDLCENEALSIEIGDEVCSNTVQPTGREDQMIPRGGEQEFARGGEQEFARKDHRKRSSEKIKNICPPTSDEGGDATHEPDRSDTNSSKSKTPKDRAKITREDVTDPEVQNATDEWLDHAHEQMPHKSDFKRHRFAEAIAKIKRRAQLENGRLEALIAFIRHDEFWSRNAITPEGLLRKSKNGLHKYENVLLAMRQNQATQKTDAKRLKEKQMMDAVKDVEGLW